jgi:hypothetical protein
MEKMGARMEAVCRFAGSTTPALARRLEIAAAVAGSSFVFRRVQRHGWFREKDGF